MSKWIDAFLAAQDVERVRKAKASLYEECLATAAPPELRPPAEHEGKPWHWVMAPDGTPMVALRVGDEWLLPGLGASVLSTFVAFGYRYLGPAEWLGEDEAAVANDAISAQRHIMDLEASHAANLTLIANREDRIADLETVNTGLRDQLAALDGAAGAQQAAMEAWHSALRRIDGLQDRLASVEAHNVELVAKYEALLKVQHPMHIVSADEAGIRYTFSANALGHAPKAGPR